MNNSPIRRRRPAWLGLLLAIALAPTAVLADGKDEASALRARYDREREVCTSGRSNQDRATCLREANAAYAQARKGNLNDGATPHARNATARCDALQGADRQDCVARMQGEGTTTGSVAGGGIYRELVTRTVGTPAPVEGAVQEPAEVRK
jgi:hypothetical protein